MIVYGQPDTEYHANPAIGSTTAKLFLKSRRLFRDRLDGIALQEERGYFQIGRLAHMMVLEPDRFRQQVVTDGPINPKTGNMYGRDTKAFAEWQEANPDVTVVEPWLHTMLARMPDQIRAIFDSAGQPEVSIYQTINGVAVKCRPDWLQPGLCTDLKTIDDVDYIGHAMRAYQYWFSQEWYKRILKEETGLVHSFRFVFAEKKPPYRWRIARLNAEACEEAAAQVRGVMLLIKAAQDSGDWSDTGDIHTDITWPDCGHYEDDQP